MRTTDFDYQGHLTIREFMVPAGRDWTSSLNGWAVIQVKKGTGYYLQPQLNHELKTGALLLTTSGVQGSIRASQLGEMSLRAFNVLPARLTGLTTLFEQGQLEIAESAKENGLQIMPPDSVVAIKMQKLCACPERHGLLFRLKLLQFFVEIIEDELERTPPVEYAFDAKWRLQLFLKATPSSELLEMSFNELALKIRCTTRHLGRIFQELIGMSFRDKRAAIRLERARELLATTDAKIVDVAINSGFKSLSLFNLMFVRHYGMSPGKWRQKQDAPRGRNGMEKFKSSATGNRQLFSLKINALSGHGRIVSKSKIIGQKNHRKNAESMMPKEISLHSLVESHFASCGGAR